MKGRAEQRAAVRSFGSEYRTSRDAPLSDFFEPALEGCVTYDRAAGYFRSSALSSWAGAISRISEGENVKIRLLISPELSEQDRRALAETQDPAKRESLRQDAIDRFLLDAIEDGESEAARDASLKLLSWLVANDFLEIRFAIPEHLQNAGTYHEKVGIFGFPWGDAVAFSGSANESDHGHRRNWESIDVFRSWEESEQRRVQSKKHLFEETWAGDIEGLKVLRLSQSALDQIRDNAPTERPEVHTIDQGLPGYELRPHQIEALEAWRKNERKGLLEMCTGSGKTICALDAIRETSEGSMARGKGALALIACPTQVLVEQWLKEIRAWYPDWLTLAAYDNIHDYAARLSTWLRHPEPRTYVVVTTYTTLYSQPFRTQLKKHRQSQGDRIFVADEAHRIAEGTRLNSLPEILEGFRDHLALTATPEIESDPDQTQKLESAFSGSVFTFSLENAIEKEILCPYKYFPRPTFLSKELSARYMALLARIDESTPNSTLDLYRQKRELLRTSGHYVAELGLILNELGDDLSHTVVYSPPGREEDDQRILAKVKKVFEERGHTVASITAATRQADRQPILENFAEGRYAALLGIGCLDEGLDVPETRRAIVLYSVDRLKQFIQRRGRVLRRAPGKSHADIFDLIVLPQGSDLPPETQQRLIDRELRRYREFASAALNPKEATRTIDDALRTGGLIHV